MCYWMGLDGVDVGLDGVWMHEAAPPPRWLDTDWTRTGAGLAPDWMRTGAGLDADRRRDWMRTVVGLDADWMRSIQSPIQYS